MGRILDGTPETHPNRGVKIAGGDPAKTGSAKDVRIWNTDFPRKNNFVGGAAPGINDDETQGYDVLSFWIDGTSIYVCRDPSEGAAVWMDMTAFLAAITALVDDTSPQLGGHLDLNGKQITADPAPGSDQTFTGPSIPATAGVTIAFGEAVYQGSGGKLLLAAADAAVPANRPVGLAGGAYVDDDPAVVAAPFAFVRDDSWDWTIGQPIYLSTTAGQLTQTLPEGFEVVVGIAWTADVILVLPAAPQTAAAGTSLASIRIRL